MNFSQTRARLVQGGAVLAAVAFVAGCGNSYRPVITPTNPSGPASETQSWAIVVSAPTSTTAGVALPGVATIIDYSGDSIMAHQDIGPNPTAFTLDASGSNGYTINSDRTITGFPITSTLQEKQILTTTLTGAYPLNLFTPSSGLWATDLVNNDVDIFSGSPEAFVRSVSLTGSTPVMMIGPGSSGSRYYAVSQNIASSSGVECNSNPTAQPLGQVTAIEVSNDTRDAAIPVGKCPVYAVENTSGLRLFVLNRGGDATNPGGSISVINSQSDALDNCAPFQNKVGHWVTCTPSIALPAGPVYAEYNAALQLLVVANYDSNTVSIIDVSMDEYGNDANTYANNNCLDASGVSSYANCGAITGGFGTTYTVPVGKNPASVTVLYNDTVPRAYTANQTDQTVSVVNLSSHTLEKTITGITGYPRTVVSTQNSTQGRVYVASPNTNVLTIIRTDEDIVDTTLSMDGNVVDVRVSYQDGVKGNTNTVSRIPGYGQPCNLPGSTAIASLTSCEATQ